uniref:Uncharacterized protein n=1 Tax=Astatotilapia calliptera TaxID=8154 RepID=A0AAX7VUU1_ASTCA
MNNRGFTFTASRQNMGEQLDKLMHQLMDLEEYEIIVDELSGSRERLRIRQAEMGPDVMKGKLLPDVTRKSLTPEDETFLTENTTATRRLSLKNLSGNVRFKRTKANK